MDKFEKKNNESENKVVDVFQISNTSPIIFDQIKQKKSMRLGHDV